jgi:hypothetical protein
LASEPNGFGSAISWLSFNEQQHNIYAVVDFKVRRFDVNAGVGYGLTPGSDRLMYRMIIGTDLTEGASNKSSEGSNTPRKPESRLGGSLRSLVAYRGNSAVRYIVHDARRSRARAALVVNETANNTPGFLPEARG